MNIVWKVSKLGELPDEAADSGARIKECGYNSPFEEFSTAFALTRKGIATYLPARNLQKRAARPGQAALPARRVVPFHAGILTPEGTPVLQMDYDSYLRSGVRDRAG